MVGAERPASRRFIACVAGAVAVLGLAVPAGASGAERRSYIVQLTDPPLASYAGTARGIPATSPRATGHALRPDSAAARRYRSFLGQRQRAAIDRVPGRRPDVVYSYRTAFAGFSARLGAEQVRALRDAPQVARVYRDGLRHIMQAPSGARAQTLLGGHSGDGAAYLGLPTGLWQRLGG